MKYFSYLNTAVDIIGSYTGHHPFHFLIKDFFRQHKKYGSTDRKTITHLCYCYFRLGRSLSNIPRSEKILIALFFCSTRPHDMLARLKPEWNEKTGASLREKCACAGIPYESLTIFPPVSGLSTGIDKDDFIRSHLHQPDVFLRTRPGCRQVVVQKLEAAKIIFSIIGEHCIALPNTTPVDGILTINKEAVIQDYSSQQAGAFLQLVTDTATPIKIWDCCAASGGKSIMAKDILGNIDLTVSDIRESVLVNLTKRFAEAGINGYTTQLADLTAARSPFAPGSFQVIIADLPCTGSGTWGRTPERLSFFDENEIERYRHRQEKIVQTVMPGLANGGYFLYITCSVFEQENEGMVRFIEDNFPVKRVKMEVLCGYPLKADTLFAAMLKKNG
ncbi:MAG: Fmu (Sun) domain-containing protein [Bacteroidota bacterium]